MINKTVCFSGHRPEKLPGKGIDSREETIFIKKLLKTKIERYISEGYTRFLSGTARGIDLWAAQIVLEIKKSNSEIELICVKPVQNQGRNFPDKDRKLYDYIVSRADNVICTSEEYSKDCYSVRNKYMVDSSSLLIAFVKNYRSGTGQTINYEKKTGKITDITDLSDLNLLQN